MVGSIDIQEHPKDSQQGEGGENIDKKRWDIPDPVSPVQKKKIKKRVVDPGKYPGSGVQKDPGVSMEKQARYRRIWYLV